MTAGARRFGWLLALALVAGVLLPGAALAAGAATTPPSRAAAERALAKAQELRQGKGVETGRELTPALQRLYAVLPHLSNADRLAAERLLARPDDGQPDPSGTHKWSGSEAAASPKCSAHFCVHFTTSAPDASDPTYAQSMANLFENQVYPCENGIAANACG